MKDFLLAICLLLTSVLFAQKIDPAPRPNLPNVKVKELRHVLKDKWSVSTYDMQYSNVSFGLATTSTGQRIYLSRYPETDTVRGLITLDASVKKLVAEGPAIFLSPDALSYQAGSFRQSRPQGPWISVSRQPQEQGCPTLTFETKPEEVIAVLKSCYPDSAQQANIIVRRAEYADGELNGPASRANLAGEVRQSLTYRDDEPIGEEFNKYYWKTADFTAVHGPEGSDTTFAEVIRGIDTSAVSKTAERMPSFKSPDCTAPDLATCTREERDAYRACCTKAMLQHLYSNIRYPRSSRLKGVEGTNVTTFIVEKDGTLTGVRTVKHASGPLDRESRRVIAKMPRWSPGMQKGKPVRVQFNLPVAYRL